MVDVTASEPRAIDISPREFVELSPAPLLIDVRSGLEYGFGHAAGAVNLSLPRIMMGQIPFLSKWMLPQWFRDLPRDRPVALICLTAHRSPMAAAQLVAQGYHTVYNITGGMRKWWKLSLPTGSQP